MSNEIALNISALNIDQPEAIASLIDYIHDETLAALCECDDDTAGLERQTDLLDAMSAILCGEVEEVPLADETYPTKLAARLKVSLGAMQGLDEFLEPVTDDSEYIYIALWLVMKEFIELLMVSADADDSDEVFEIRRQAQVAQWVERFCSAK